MMEVTVKVRENEYIDKEGNPRISKEIKFGDLGLEQFVTIKKIYTNCLSKEITKKDGTTFMSNKTLVEYNDEKISVNISAGKVAEWNELQLGDVRASKVEFEIEDKPAYTYNFESC